MNQGRLLVPALLAASVLALSACGGSGDSESDEEQIMTTITTAVVSKDPADCEKLTTQAFMEQTSSVTGKEAVKTCEEEAKDGTGDPKKATVTKVTVNGSKATADVAFVGGDLGGQKLEMALVEEDGAWKVDKIERFVVLNKGALIHTYALGLAKSELSSSQTSCILDGIRSSSRAELEKLGPRRDRRSVPRTRRTLH